MNEAQIRERLRLAVGETRYPAGFSSRVEARLRQPALNQDVPTNPGRNQSPWLVGLRLTLSLVAALLVVLVLGALLVGVYAWRIHSKAAGRDTAIMQYQAMLRTDQQTLDSAMYALMRRHLELALSANNDFVIAYGRMTPTVQTRPTTHITGIIITSSQGSMVSYTASCSSVLISQSY